jgi:hypothetical protein
MSTEGGVIVGYCRTKSFGNIRFIYRFGDPLDDRDRSKYKFGPPISPESFKKEAIKDVALISSKSESILDIKNGVRWQYGYDNIEKVVKVLTVEPDARREWKPRRKKGKEVRIFPTILFRIQWCNIAENHKAEFLEKDQSWVFRGKVMSRLKSKERVRLDEWGRAKAEEQDHGYRDWLNEKKITNQDRDPTFYPGVDWASSSKNSKKSRSTPVQNQPNSKNTVPESEKDDSTEKGHRPSRKPQNKRQRADSDVSEKRSDRIKKPRSGSGPTENSAEKKPIAWTSYQFNLMKHYEAGPEKFGIEGKGCEQGSHKYQKILSDIYDGWDEYRENMLRDGYTVADGGERPPRQ